MLYSHGICNACFVSIVIFVFLFSLHSNCSSSEHTFELKGNFLIGVLFYRFYASPPLRPLLFPFFVLQFINNVWDIYLNQIKVRFLFYAQCSPMIDSNPFIRFLSIQSPFATHIQLNMLNCKYPILFCSQSFYFVLLLFCLLIKTHVCSFLHPANLIQSKCKTPHDCPCFSDSVFLDNFPPCIQSS